MAEPGGPHGPRPPHFYFWGGLAPPLLNVEFCLNIVSLRSTISTGSSVKVNSLMKNMLQNFGSILSILCLIYYYNLAMNLAGFRNCLAECIVHSLSPCYKLLTALVLLNSVT